MSVLRVVVAAPPFVRRPADLVRLPRAADVIELRLDLLEPAYEEVDLARWIAASPRPILATVRSAAEGGGHAGTPQEAAAWLERAALAGARWIDVEAPTAPFLTAPPADVQLLLAHHGEAPATLPEAIGGRRPDHVKIARPVSDGVSWEALRSEAGDPPAGAPRTYVPYGALGGLRALFVPSDAPGLLLYGAPAEGQAVVDGQPTLMKLLDELRAGEVDLGASLYGLLGRPPVASPSPALHNAAFRRLDRNALYVPLPAVDPETALALPFGGFSVTAPYKSVALALADDADRTTREIGAANTLVRTSEGGWTATNTDALAVAAAVPLGDGRGAFVYGSGGFARAAAHALRARGYVVRIGARDASAGRALADAVSGSFDGTRYRRRGDDGVIVNATPLGVDGRVPAPFGGTRWEGLVVCDAPYAAEAPPGSFAATGRDAGLATAARASGAARVVDGLELLRLQAQGQIRAFSGREVEGPVLALALSKRRPLVLIGLRGAGKTTVGRAVARQLGRPFVDLDEEVWRISGRRAGAWLREDGEAAFRAVELAALERNVDRAGLVLAAGGGVLEHPGSRELVAKHTTPCFLDVDPEVAGERLRRDGGDRPSLTGAGDPMEEARSLAARRREAWLAAAAFVVNANGPVHEIRAAVVRGWID